MKHFIGLGICAALLVSCGDDKKEQTAEEQVTEAPALDMANPETKLNYAIGMGAGLTYVETMAQLQLSGEQSRPQEGFKGFSDHLNGSATMDLQKCQEVVGSIYQKISAKEDLNEEDLKNLSYAQGVMLAEGAQRKMSALNVGEKLNKSAMIAGAEHQFNGQPTAISIQDMQEFLANLEKDRSAQPQPNTQQESPIAVIDGFDAYNDDQKNAYVLGMNNGLNLLQNVNSLSQEMAANVDMQSIVDQVDEKFGQSTSLEDTQFQKNIQDFLSYDKTPDQMPQEVKDGFSYAIAMTLVESKKNQENQFVDNIDQASFIDGLSDVLLRKEAKMSIQDHDAFLTKLAIKKGANFLAENAKKPGVKVTASGLQYKVLKSGSGGPKPTPSDRVRVHYHGTLIDGTVFDSSVDRGEPAEFGVTQVIQGWIEGLQLMSVGDKFEFYVPQELGYGANPRPGGAIKPYDALIFQVELLEIK